MTWNGQEMWGKYRGFWACVFGKIWYNVVPIGSVEFFGEDFTEKGRGRSMVGLNNRGFGPSGVIFCAFFTIAGVAGAGTYSGGSGTAADPYRISKTADWRELIAASGDWSKNFILLNNIDLGTSLSPVGNNDSQFTGIFEGNRHVLRNATILPNTDRVGIFGLVGSGGEIRNLGAENVRISGRFYVGGLVGENDSGTITACYATGTVEGIDGIGGLAGKNSGSIISCYSTVAITGRDKSGGLVGLNTGSIVSSYATGAVRSTPPDIGTKDPYFGGLVGQNYEGTITASFWDMQTTRQAVSYGGKGLTTQQMQTLSIYQNAGWAGRGWVIQDGIGYPRLSWENTGGTPIPSSVIPLNGSGTAEDPYRISTVEEFALLNIYYGLLDSHIQLTADLDLSGVTLYPVGELGPFTGVFDGNGHTLRHVVIQQPARDCVGLFSHIGSGGQIRNLGAENVTVSGDTYVGGLAGRTSETSVIDSCYTTGTIEGMYSVGGLVGWNDSSTITACHTTGTVSGNGSVGGLVGYDDEGTITSCYSTGTISGDSVGGLVGDSGGTITSCFATGVVSGSRVVGGLAGHNRQGTITACYATGAVSGSSDYTGGLVGINDGGALMACYATGLVRGQKYFGGLAGGNSGTITSCFWDIESSGQTGSVGGKGLTTAQMKTLTIYQNAGWADQDWVINDGVDYPHLEWENTMGVPIPLPLPIPLSGSGTADDPYLISTAPEFASASWYPGILDKHIRLTASLDLNGFILYPIGDLRSFTGVFDGNGHTLSNVVINQPGNLYVGLFSKLESGGEIRNLGVENMNITGTYYVGGLVGINHGCTISSCYATGTVSGVYGVGGLVGENYSGTIMACYATGSVSGSGGCVGGLVGINSGPVSFCYAKGAISGGGCVGGLVGGNYVSALTSCYATGTVTGTSYSVGGLVGVNEEGTITSCYTTGAVTGTSSVGGLVGSINFGFSITSCYATGPVSGSGSFVGGLVGFIFYGTIEASYATGAVSGSGCVGGLVGKNNYGEVAFCYSTGAVGSDMHENVGGLVGFSYGEVWIPDIYCDYYGECYDYGGFITAEAPGLIEHSFWDIQTSSLGESCGGEGRPTAQMKTKANFSGWDFVNTWAICEGTNYPRLKWQIPAADIVCPDGVNLEDLEFFAYRWLQDNCATTNGCDGTDFDGNGRVDICDFAILASNGTKDSISAGLLRVMISPQGAIDAGAQWRRVGTTQQQRHGMRDCRRLAFCRVQKRGRVGYARKPGCHDQQ
jgi:hypothetical protein